MKKKKLCDLKMGPINLSVILCKVGNVYQGQTLLLNVPMVHYEEYWYYNLPIGPKRQSITLQRI
jgi:hypothetical protein